MICDTDRMPYNAQGMTVLTESTFPTNKRVRATPTHCYYYTSEQSINQLIFDFCRELLILILSMIYLWIAYKF